MIGNFNEIQVIQEIGPGTYMVYLWNLYDIYYVSKKLQSTIQYTYLVCHEMSSSSKFLMQHNS